MKLVVEEVDSYVEGIKITCTPVEALVLNDDLTALIQSLCKIFQHLSHNTSVNFMYLCTISKQLHGVNNPRLKSQACV